MPSAGSWASEGTVPAKAVRADNTKMTAKPELILHIGMGKTGTTALQEAFWQNRRILAKAGITYPDIGVVAGAHHKISPYEPKVLAQEGWEFMKPEDWAPQLARSGKRRILMSSELIAWSPQEVASKFCAALKEFFDLKICLYLRRQDNIVMSSFNQGIKAGYQRRPLGEALSVIIQSYDFSRTIQIWEKAAGRQNMIIRPYERSQFPQGDLISDFVNGVLGIEVPGEFVRPKKPNTNPRFAPAALEYKRLINCISPDNQSSGVYRDALISYSQGLDAGSTAVFQEQGLLSKEQRRQILNHFAGANAEIARKFLGRDELFTEALSEEAFETPPVLEQDLKDLSDWLWGHHPALAKKLIAAADEIKADKRSMVGRAARTLLRSFGSKAQSLPKENPKEAALLTTRQAIIHPGPPDTGAPMIQAAFFKYRDRLLSEHGILFPSVAENHTKPVLALFRADAEKNILFSGMSRDQRDAYRKKTLTQFEAELSRGDWQTLVLSGDGISTLSEADWESFHLWLKGWGITAVKVIIGTRNGHDLVRSAIQHNLMCGFRLEDQFADPPLPRMRQRLSALLKANDRSEVVLWNYDEAQRSPKGPLYHFGASLKLEPAVCALFTSYAGKPGEILSQVAVDALAERNRRMGDPGVLSVAERKRYLSMEGPDFVLPTEVADRVSTLLIEDEAWIRHELHVGASSALCSPPVPTSARNALDVSGTQPANIASVPRDDTSSDSSGKAKPALILHVGMDKTGTTAIQHALEQAHDRLKKECGVLVPRTGRWQDNSHHPFAFAALGINGFTPSGIDGLFESLNSEVFVSGSHSVLITSECLFKLPAKPEWDLLWPRLRSIFGSVRVVIYVRRQDAWVESRYRHSVVSGHELPLALLAQPEFSDYLPDIDRWAELVGAANVQVRAYETGQFPNGDIAADFEQAVGLPTGVLASPGAARANVAFSSEAVLLRAAFNHLNLPAQYYAQLNELLADAVAGGPPDRAFVSPQLARQLEQRYAESNRQIAVKYMGRPDGRLFHDAPVPATATFAAPEIGRARMVKILAAIKDLNPDLLNHAASAGARLRVTDLRFREAAAPVWDLLRALGELGLRAEPGPDGAKDGPALPAAAKPRAAWRTVLTKLRLRVRALRK